MSRLARQTPVITLSATLLIALAGAQIYSAAQSARAAAPRHAQQSRGISDVLLLEDSAYLAVGRQLEAYDLSDPERPRRVGRTWHDEDLLQLTGSAPWVVAKTASGIMVFRTRPDGPPVRVQALPRPEVEGASIHSRPGQLYSFFVDAGQGEVLVAGNVGVLDATGNEVVRGAHVLQRAALGEEGLGPWRESWRQEYEGEPFQGRGTTALARWGDGAALGGLMCRHGSCSGALILTPGGAWHYPREALAAREILPEGPRVAVMYKGAGTPNGHEEFLGLEVLQNGGRLSHLLIEGQFGGGELSSPSAMSGRAEDLWYAMRNGRLLRLDASASPQPRILFQQVAPGRISAMDSQGDRGVVVLGGTQSYVVHMPSRGSSSWTPLPERGPTWPEAAWRIHLPSTMR